MLTRFQGRRGVARAVAMVSILLAGVLIFSLQWVEGANSRLVVAILAGVLIALTIAAMFIKARLRD